MDKDYYHTLVMAYYMNKIKKSRRKMAIALDRIRFMAQQTHTTPAERRLVREECKALAIELMQGHHSSKETDE